MKVEYASEGIFFISIHHSLYFTWTFHLFLLIMSHIIKSFFFFRNHIIPQFIFMNKTIITYVNLNFKKNITDIHNEVEKSEIMK